MGYAVCRVIPNHYFPSLSAEELSGEGDYARCSGGVGNFMFGRLIQM